MDVFESGTMVGDTDYDDADGHIAVKQPLREASMPKTLKHSGCSCPTRVIILVVVDLTGTISFPTVLAATVATPPHERVSYLRNYVSCGCEHFQQCFAIPH